MSNQDILDAGQPPPPVTVTEDADGNPTVTVAEPGSDEMNASLRHANALAALAGTTDSPTDWGTYLRRVPAWETGIAVVSNTCTVGPGAVLAVQATSALSPGPKQLMTSGTIGSGQVRVSPQADGTQILSFRGGDSVTACAVYLLPVPAELIAVLDANPNPPE